MKPARRFFTKAHSLDKVPMLKRKRPSYPKGWTSGVAVSRGPGKGTLVAHPRWIARQTGASKGGLRIAELGVAHRFTPETARKAALRRWKTRTRISKRLGIRLGMKPKNRPAVKRAPIRAIHDVWQGAKPVQGVCYNSKLGTWAFEGRIISERRALQRLGYLPPTNKNWVPVQEQFSVNMSWRNPDGSIPDMPAGLLGEYNAKETTRD